MHDIVTVEQVVELCKLHGKRVTLYGNNYDEIAWYEQALIHAGLQVSINDDIVKLPVFTVVVVLSLGNEKVNGLCPFSLAGKFCTLVDPYNQLLPDDGCPHRIVEHFVKMGDTFIRANTYSTVDYDENNFFKHETMDIFRWLKAHENQFSVIYAGATYEHAIYIAPFMEIVEAVRYKLSQGYKKVVFYNGDETVQPNSIMMCQRVAEYLSDEIEPNTLFYYTGGLSVESCYSDLAVEHNFQYYMHPMAGTRFELTVKQPFVKGPILDDHPLAGLFRPYNVGVKSKNFLCFNRMPRWHRVNLLISLLKKDLVKDSYYSFDLNEFNGHGNPSVMEPVQKELDRYKHLFPMVLNRTKERDNPVGLDPDDIHYHRDSYFSLVCETAFYSGKHRYLSDISYIDSVFLSEKIYKPLAYKHPFMLVGFPETLGYLKKIGYKTFHPYIDESYDSISDDLDRMEAIVSEVERLCSQTPEQWIQWQENVTPIVEHNFQWLLEDKDLSVTANLSEYFCETT